MESRRQVRRRGEKESVYEKDSRHRSFRRCVFKERDSDKGPVGLVFETPKP